MVPKIHSSPPPSRFHPPETCWKTVRRAQGGRDCGHSLIALDQLFETYWKPLYYYARGMGLSHHDAEEATQDFLNLSLSNGLFQRVREHRGRLRSYLLRSFLNHLVNRIRAGKRIFRGGDQSILSLDHDSLAGQVTDPREDPARKAQRSYDRSWANTIVERAKESLRIKWSKKDQKKRFDSIFPFLAIEEGEYTNAETTAQSLGITIGNLRVIASRLRKEFQIHLREEVAKTLTDPTDKTIDDELRYLLQALS